MGQFDRVAKRCIALVNAFLRGLLRQNNLIAQLGEKVGIQGIISVNQKTAIKADGTAGFNAHLRRGAGPIFFKYEFLANCNQVQFSDIIVDMVA